MPERRAEAFPAPRRGCALHVHERRPQPLRAPSGRWRDPGNRGHVHMQRCAFRAGWQSTASERTAHQAPCDRQGAIQGTCLLPHRPAASPSPVASPAWQYLPRADPANLSHNPARATARLRDSPRHGWFRLRRAPTQGLNQSRSRHGESCRPTLHRIGWRHAEPLMSFLLSREMRLLWAVSLE